MKINNDHYENFKTSYLDSTIWLGTSPTSWFNSIRNNNIDYTPYLLTETLPNKKLSRTDLFTLVKNSEVDTLSCCVSILAWGGMHRGHGKKALSEYKNWIQVAEDIRNGLLDRCQAYEQFATLRKNSLLPGMGPAYFTKLIFFLLPTSKPRGFIMDQWTSASVNLLFDSTKIKMNMQKTTQNYGKVKFTETVSDKNTKENYISYCECIELVAKDLMKDSAYIEKMMFSEGRGKGIWRNYVVNQRILNLTKLLDNTILVKDKKSLHKKDGRPSSSISLFSEQPTTKLIPFPLSGRGAEIQYTGNLKGGFSCKWGSQYIELKPDFLQDILNNFSGRGEVKLGAEQGGSGGTGSFGIWLNDKHNLNPRFASVIAALLVNEGLVTSRGKNPIYLNFI